MFCCGSVCDLHSRPHSPTVPRGLLGQRSLATTMGMNGRLAVRKDRRGSSCRGDQNINSAAPHPVLISLNCTPQDFFFKLSKSGIIVRTFLWIYRPVICFCFHADRARLFSHGYFPNCLQKKRTLNLITTSCSQFVPWPEASHLHIRDFRFYLTAFMWFKHGLLKTDIFQEGAWVGLNFRRSDLHVELSDIHRGSLKISDT